MKRKENHTWEYLQGVTKWCVSTKKIGFCKNRPFQASNTLVNYTQSGEDDAPPDTRELVSNRLYVWSGSEWCPGKHAADNVYVINAQMLDIYNKMSLCFNFLSQWTSEIQLFWNTLEVASVLRQNRLCMLLKTSGKSFPLLRFSQLRSCLSWNSRDNILQTVTI